VTDGPTRVVLVDDQELVRSGLRRILRKRDGFDIVAECGDGSELPAVLAAHEDHVRLAQVAGHVIARLRNLRLVPGELPAAAEDGVQLEPVDGRVAEDEGRDRSALRVDALAEQALAVV